MTLIRLLEACSAIPRQLAIFTTVAVVNQKYDNILFTEAALQETKKQAA